MLSALRLTIEIWLICGKQNFDYCHSFMGLNTASHVRTIWKNGLFVQHYTQPSIPAAQSSIRHCRAACIDGGKPRGFCDRPGISMHCQLHCSLSAIKVIAVAVRLHVHHFPMLSHPVKVFVTTASQCYISCSRW